jgi:D-xylose transport system substrate-binding protein
LTACQRIVDGTQYLTIYKSISLIASEAARSAVALAKGQTVVTNSAIDNGQNRKIPYLALMPTAVGKININVIINDGFHKEEDIYRNKK